MASNWTQMPFSSAVNLNPATTLVRGKVYPFVDMAAISPSFRCTYSNENRTFEGGGSRFLPGDTLMARITPCLENGKIARYCAKDPEPAHGSTEFIVIRGRDNVTDNAFAYYLTKWDEVWSYAVAQMTGTSGRQRVPTAAFNHLIVSLPTLPEQRAIARILGSLDAKIELNRQMNHTLETMAHAVFKSWFLDFDPVRTKAEGGASDLSGDVANLFPESLVDTEWGELPTGWKLGTLSDICEINPPRPLRKGDAAPYIDMSSLPTQGHVPERWVDRPYGSGARFKNDDTLLARITPCLENGKTAFVDILADNQIAWGSTEYIVIRPKGNLPPHYAYCVARSEAFRAAAIQSMTGSSGRQRVPAEAVASFRVAIPPLSLFSAFGDLVQPLFKRAREAALESRALSDLRDGILPMLISGKIQVGRP